MKMFTTDGLERHEKGTLSMPVGLFRGVTAALLVYFGARLLFFAIMIHGDIPPDETTHLGLSRIFSKSLLLPANSAQTYEFGLVTNIPWLYYWLMGKLLWLNVFGLPDLLFLRLVNIPFAFGTIYFAWRLLRLITDDRLVQVVLVAAMTNTLMFSFLSATVSYDNLTNLLAVMATYFLLVYCKSRTPLPLAISFLCQLAGCLTKISFLPLAMILVLLWLAHEVKGSPQLFTIVKDFYRESRWSCLLAAFAMLAGLILNVQLYGGNYRHYGTLRPEMHEVLSPAIALEHRIAARDLIVDDFKKGRLNYAEAMRLARYINNEGDREDTIYLIQQLIEHRDNGYQPLGPVEYLLPWAERVAATVYGIMGHLSIYNQGATIVPIALLFLLAILGFARQWRPGRGARIPASLAVLCVSYAAILLYFHNYRVYLYYENFSMGLQGRYVFPVIGALYVLFSCYLLALFQHGKVRFGLAVVAVLVFLILDFPFFLYHANRYALASMSWF